MGTELARSDISAPFRPENLPRRSFFERLFRRPTPTRARVAVKNLIASTPAAQIGAGAIDWIRKENCLSQRDWAAVRHGVFSAAYRACVEDDVLSESETRHLADLRRLLDIGEDLVMELERDTILPRYQAAVREVIADQRVTAEERAKLDSLASALRISPAVARENLTVAAGAILRTTLDAAVADRRLTPEEFLQFGSLARELGINPTFDDATLKALHRYSLFWKIEQGDIPTVDVQLNLQKGEVCYFTAPAEWLEYRKQSTTVGYYSQGVSVRIMRGVYYRVGASRPHRVTTDGLTRLDNGDLYITNKRVIFNGSRRNVSLKLSSLLAFEAFSDGFALEKASGRSPHFILDGDAELANVMLGAALARS